MIGIRVVRENGEPVSWMPVLLRNLLRAVDEGIFLIGLLFMIMERSERRLGDLAAGTIVIRERPSARSLIFRSLANSQTGTSTSTNTAGEIKDGFADIVAANQLNPADSELISDFLAASPIYAQNQSTRAGKKIGKIYSLKTAARKAIQRSMMMPKRIGKIVRRQFVNNVRL